jgi:hypothetical protein
MKKYTISELVNAGRFSNNRRSDLLRCSVCGCYHCGRIFLANDVRWKDLNDMESRAVCPFCGHDSILGESSSYPLNREFLKAMKKYYFREDLPYVV